MIGLCQRCGFMGDTPEPAKDPEPTPEQALISKLDSDVQCILHLSKMRSLDADHRIDKLEDKLDNILKILTSSSEAERLNNISKIKKLKKSGDLLQSIRRANSES